MGSLLSKKILNTAMGEDLSASDHLNHIQAVESPRFDCNDPALVEYLQTHGYVIVKSICSKEEVSHARDLFWKFLSEHANMSRSDPSTWTDENFVNVGSASTGILFYRGIGQSEFLWYLRLMPKVKQVFAQIWNTADLLTSFDGANIFRPWHSPFADEYAKTEGGWFHVDQGRLQRGLQCVQGLVTLYDVDAHTGGFCVIPGSHLHHDALLDAANAGERNFVPVPSTFPVLKEAQVMPICKAGDLVLWDSRSIHCNSPAIAPPTASPDELLRMVGYVCMTPKQLADEEVLSMRVKIFERGLTTSHWPHLLSYTISDDDDRECVQRVCDVSQEQRELIGV